MPADTVSPTPSAEPNVEEIRARVEDAIRGKLCVRGRYQTSLGSPSAEYPVEIQGQNVVLRDADCGLAKPTRTITLDEWETLAQRGLWRLVGIWDFVRADHEAADEIAYCYRSPYSAGNELHTARASLAEARRERDELRETALDFHEASVLMEFAEAAAQRRNFMPDDLASALNKLQTQRHIAAGTPE